MINTKSLRNILESIGKNNKPTYTVVTIAAANSIFKPLTSLTDKKEKPETKKYAALREFLTEVVAVPTYIACGKIAEKSADKVLKNNPKKLHMAKTNLEFVGVCAAAVFVIPAVCSLIVKPFTDAIFEKKNKTNNTTIKNILVQKPEQKTTFSSNYYKYSLSIFPNNGGLKI